MDEIMCILVCTWAKLLDLLENEAFAFFLVLDLLEFVYNNEEISLFVGSVCEELFGGEGEMILGRDDEHYHIYFLLASKKGSGLDAIAVQAWRIDERYVHDAVI